MTEDLIEDQSRKLTDEALSEIIDEVRELNPLDLHRRLHELHLPDYLEHRVRAELAKRGQVDLVGRAFSEGDVVTAGTPADDIIDSIFGFAKVKK